MTNYCCDCYFHSHYYEGVGLGYDFCLLGNKKRHAPNQIACEKYMEHFGRKNTEEMEKEYIKQTKIYQEIKMKEDEEHIKSLKEVKPNVRRKEI